MCADLVRAHSTSAALAILLLSTPAHAQTPRSGNGSSVLEPAAVHVVPPQVNLEVVAGPLGQERQLVVSKDGKQLGSIAVPGRVSAADLDEGLKGMLWHPDGSGLALGFKGDKGSFVVVFLRQASGAYVAVDVSQVERANIGAIGPNRPYRNVQTAPTEWLPSREDGAVQLWLQTLAWDLSGRRYRPREPLIITRDGRPLWR